MRYLTKLVVRCTAATLLALFVVRAGLAQENLLPEATEAAREAAHSAAEAEHGGGPNPLAWDPDLAVFTLIVFLLMFWVLKRFAWPQISAAIDERERKIADNIAAAEAKHQEAKQLLAEHEAKLAATAGEVRALLEEARRDADHTKGRIVAEAREAAEGEKQRAVKEIQRAKEGAIHELAVATANVAIDLAEQVTGKQLTTERNNELVRDAMTKLAASQPSKN